MKRAAKFSVSSNWPILLTEMQIDPAAALACARLPADLFKRPPGQPDT